MKEVGFLLTMIRGAVGKEIVVKHYRYGVVVTRYPDMSGVRASAGQRACRDVFREAVAFAKGVFADGVRKAYYREKLGKVRGLFQAVVREYMKNVRRETSEVSGKEEGLRAVGYTVHTGSGSGREKKKVEDQVKVERRGRRGLVWRRAGRWPGQALRIAVIGGSGMSGTACRGPDCNGLTARASVLAVVTRG